MRATTIIIDLNLKDDADSDQIRRDLKAAIEQTLENPFIDSFSKVEGFQIN